MAVGLRSQYGVAAPPFTKGPYTWDQRVNFSAGASGLLGPNQYRGGEVWHVDKTNCSVTGDGKSWESAFLTLTEAFAVAGDWDTIFVGPGFYTEAAAITVTQVGLKLIGCNSSGKTRGPCAMKTPTAAGHMLILAANANDFECSNMGFIATGAYNAITLGTAASGNVWRTHIHDCGFFGDSVGQFAVAVYGATVTPAAGAFPDCAECVIERNFFYLWGIGSLGAVCAYGTRAMVRDNVFFLEAAATGIVAGNGRPYGVYTGNFFSGVNSTDVGIRQTGAVNTQIISHNTFLNCSLAITQDVGIASISSENYIAVANGTYSVFDTSA